MARIRRFVVVATVLCVGSVAIMGASQPGHASEQTHGQTRAHVYVLPAPVPAPTPSDQLPNGDGW